MRDTEEPSIFARYYSAEKFVDRFSSERENAVDVIIPIIHTNEFWRPNLTSIYREIPVNRLLLGDGGCIDGSIDVAREFPRVEVLNHRSFTSLGFSIRHLIEATETDWFVYLHSDVYLPAGWFAQMSRHRHKYDWFECEQRITVLADYMLEIPNAKRAFSGSQMGRKAAFTKVTPQIDDDYLYRNEDIIIADLLKREGFRYGKAGDTYHFHQVMHKPSRWSRKLKHVDVHLDVARDEEIRAQSTYVRGIVKYLNPEDTSEDVRNSLRYPVARLRELGDKSADEIEQWVRSAKPDWLPYIGAQQSVSRDRTAYKLIELVEVYRLHGAWFAVKSMTRSTGRKVRQRLRDRMSRPANHMKLFVARSRRIPTRSKTLLVGAVQKFRPRPPTISLAPLKEMLPTSKSALAPKPAPAPVPPPKPRPPEVKKERIARRLLRRFGRMGAGPGWIAVRVDTLVYMCRAHGVWFVSKTVVKSVGKKVLRRLRGTGAA